jgi:outer membrane protein OmpA-like peptidoglycan-associated protein
VSRLAPTALLVLLLAACATQPERDLRLDRLRDRLSTLKADPATELLAPLMVSDAEAAVRALESAGGNVDQRNHLAYLAERRIELVQAEVQRKTSLANTRDHEKQVAELQVAISRLQADQARQEAEQARLLSAAEAEAAARARQEQMTAAERARLAQEEAETARELAAARAREAELARQEAALASEQAESLRRRLEHMQLRETDRGVVVTLGDVLFASGESDLKDAAAQNVIDVVDLLRAEPDKRIRIEGHTDASGDAGFNLRLSEQRARSVRDALVAAGIDAERITAVGLGEDFPIASNETPEGRSQNRRVDVILLD